jgi:hypothetical protein
MIFGINYWNPCCKQVRLEGPYSKSGSRPLPSFPRNQDFSFPVSSREDFGVAVFVAPVLWLMPLTQPPLRDPRDPIPNKSCLNLRNTPTQQHSTMASVLQSLLLVGALLSSTASAQIPSSLVGTWSTKSGKVLTGPVSFYSWNKSSRVGNDDLRGFAVLIWGCRGFIILSMIVSSSQVLREYRIRSL